MNEKHKYKFFWIFADLLHKWVVQHFTDDPIEQLTAHVRWTKPFDVSF